MCLRSLNAALWEFHQWRWIFPASDVPNAPILERPCFCFVLVVGWWVTRGLGFVRVRGLIFLWSGIGKCFWRDDSDEEIARKITDEVPLSHYGQATQSWTATLHFILQQQDWGGCLVQYLEFGMTITPEHSRSARTIVDSVLGYLSSWSSPSPSHIHFVDNGVIWGGDSKKFGANNLNLLGLGQVRLCDVNCYVICAAMSIISDQHSTSNNPVINTIYGWSRWHTSTWYLHVLASAP